MCPRRPETNPRCALSLSSQPVSVQPSAHQANRRVEMVDRSDRVAGAVLVLASLSSMLMMAHHPSDAHQLGMGQFVHGAMITIVGLTALGLVHFARRLGLDRLTVLAGLIAYGIALFGDIGAATINGFVVTNLVARGVSNREIFALAWEANQALARLGVVATGVAFVLWSLRLVTQAGLFGRGLPAGRLRQPRVEGGVDCRQRLVAVGAVLGRQ